MTLIDDATRYCYIYLLKTKDEALHYFKIFKAEVGNQIERKIKRLRDDRGGEYISNEFSQFYAEHGIIHEVTPPYSPQSNGVAQRKNQTLTDLVNAMLESYGMSYEWWGEAILTKNIVLNRVMTKNKDVTPYEGGKGASPMSIFCARGIVWQKSIYQRRKRESLDQRRLIVCFWVTH